MEAIVYRPIGVIHTPFKEPKDTPIQPVAARGVEGVVEVFPERSEEHTSELQSPTPISYVVFCLKKKITI